MPAVTVRSMTPRPAGASAAGVTETVIVVELPALTTTLAAWASASFVSTVQPAGPVADAETVWSWAEPLFTVTVKL